MSNNSKGGNFPHMLSVTLNDKLNDKICKYSNKEKLPKTEIIRNALTLYFYTQERKKLR